MIWDDVDPKDPKKKVETCQSCQGQLSREWQGYVIILDFKESEIAKRMGVRVNGRYAVKVR
jgi:DNA-directed RNA polymerase subunit E"